MRKIQYDFKTLDLWVFQSGMTDEQLASRVGCSRVTISRAKHGHSASYELLARCAQELGKPLAELLPPDAAKMFASPVSSY